ncbi:MAG: flagellar basal body L-ring protein FlgH [Acidobacteriaceae bacterium]|nr:flagellar basal body L-ring protein FlgH [Acidobacteriaceae bacterium]MBV8571482.1 flagellar basal body L-ring protein FlgH [Acidobacteriaceae bacterium]
MNRILLLFLAAAAVLTGSGTQVSGKKKDPPAPTPLEQYILDAHKRVASVPDSPGSLWSPPATLGDMAADVRARSVDDMVTILVNEQASAVSVGQTKTSRASSANSSITSAAGKLPATGRLANLLTTNTNTSLNGQGTTTRQTTLSATITARVTDVLPNGYLVVEGSKTVLVNSENQIITLRGVVRPADLSDANTVQSGSVAQLELQINGKGVVNDAIHRPNFLYRLLLGLLPF